MGWAKCEEDNREAYNDRLASGNSFWSPYQSQEDYRSDCCFGYYKIETTWQRQIGQPRKNNTYARCY